MENKQTSVAKGTVPNPKYTEPKAGDEKRFFHKHVVKKIDKIRNNQPNAATGVKGGGEVFDNPPKIKTDTTVKAHLDTEGGEDEYVYEDTEELQEYNAKRIAAENKAKQAAQRAQAKAAAKVQAASAKEDNKKAEDRKLYQIAHHVNTEVANHYPDTDGYEAITHHLRGMGIHPMDAIHHINKAVKKHLGAKDFSDYVDQFHKDYHADNGAMREEVEEEDLTEKLTPSMGAGKYVKDFVKSDNPKFKGKSKKERIKMALGAFYGAKNEETELDEEELSEASDSATSDNPGEGGGQSPATDSQQDKNDNNPNKEEDNDDDDDTNMPSYRKQLEQLALTSAQLYELLAAKKELDPDQTSKIDAALNDIQEIYDAAANSDDDEDEDDDKDDKQDDETDAKPSAFKGGQPSMKSEETVLEATKRGIPKYTKDEGTKGKSIAVKQVEKGSGLAALMRARQKVTEGRYGVYGYRPTPIAPAGHGQPTDYHKEMLKKVLGKIDKQFGGPKKETSGINTTEQDEAKGAIRADVKDQMGKGK